MTTTLAPPTLTRTLSRVEWGQDVRGSRVVFYGLNGPETDLRAVGNAEPGPNGPTLRVCTESEWYAWQIVGTPPVQRVVPAASTFVE